MKKFALILALSGLLLLLLAACGSNTENVMEETAVSQPPAANENMDVIADEPTANDEMMADEETMDNRMDETMDEEMSDDTHSDMSENMSGNMIENMGEEMTDSMDANADMMGSGPEWLALPLTNARTGESFTLADFSGKTVFVETMATWCSNCRRQLQNVSQARTQFNEGEVVFVALSVETNIGDAELARYADNEGFDWLFAVASPELLRILADEFGRTIVNPPSTPHFIVRPDGSTTDLVTGIDSAETLASDLMAAAMQ